MQQNPEHYRKIKRTASDHRVKLLQKVGFKQEIQKLRRDYSNSNRYKQLKSKQKLKSLKIQPKTAAIQKSGNFLDATKIISVSAHKWIIFDYFEHRYIRGYRAHDPHDLSTFSKLLVFATINTLVIKHKIDISRFQVIITETVLKHYKSTRLKADDILTLEHMLHLMLLEENEEYELVVALNIGAYLQKKRKKEYYSVFDADHKKYKEHMQQFYDLVNSYCQTMKFEGICYIEFDPKMRKQRNKCTAADIALLSIQCLKMPLFQLILSKQQQQIQIKFINEEGVLDSRMQTIRNKDVQNKFIKYTNVCRNQQQNQFMNSSCSIYYEGEGIKPIVLVIMGSYGTMDREKDIQQIIQWYVRNLSTKNNEMQEQGKEYRNEQHKQIHSSKVDKQKSAQMLLKPRFRTQASAQLQGLLDRKLKVDNNTYNKNSFRVNKLTQNQLSGSGRMKTELLQ